MTKPSRQALEFLEANLFRFALPSPELVLSFSTDTIHNFANALDAQWQVEKAERLEIAIQEGFESVCDAIDAFANRMCNTPEETETSPEVAPCKRDIDQFERDAYDEVVEFLMSDHHGRPDAIETQARRLANKIRHKAQLMTPVDATELACMGTDIFDILPELWAKGFKTVPQDGRWHLFRKDGEGILDADTFYQLCQKITECHTNDEWPF